MSGYVSISHQITVLSTLDSKGLEMQPMSANKPLTLNATYPGPSLRHLAVLALPCLETAWQSVGLWKRKTLRTIQAKVQPSSRYHVDHIDYIYIYKYRHLCFTYLFYRTCRCLKSTQVNSTNTVPYPPTWLHDVVPTFWHMMSIKSVGQHASDSRVSRV